MTKRGPVTALQQMAIGDYRQEVLNALYERCGDDFAIWCGEEYFDATTQTRVSFPGPVTRVQNVFILGRRIGWQRNLVRPLVEADVAIVEFNPRIVSAWIILIARRLRRRRTVLWGHAWSRSGADSRTDTVRQLMRRLATIVLVYTERDRAELSARISSDRIVAAPNALYRRSDIFAAESGQPWGMLFVGRLVAEKKPRLLIEGFLRIADQLQPSVNLCIAGAGPEEDGLRRLCDEHHEGARVRFLGHVHPQDLRDAYAEAVVSVSPGCVGLSIIQSLSFGVPMLYARDERHGPEIEAATQGFNSVAFPSDDPAALGAAILDIYTNREFWIAQRSRIADDCRERYSADIMADRILEAVGHPA